MEIRLNLIPPEKKEEIVKKRRIAVSVKVEIFLTVILTVFLGMFLIFNYILNLNLSSVSNSQEKKDSSGRYDKLKEYDGYFGQINQNFSGIISIKNSQLYWSKFFLKLNSLVFTGIKINSILTEDYFITIQGVSDTRDNLILFKDKLSGENCFKQVNLPLDDLVAKENMPFKIDFIIDKNCLKKQ